MGDMIRIEHGFHPWKPSLDSDLVEVLAEFDVPTAGLLESAGHHYLFWCVGDINHPVTIWAYSLLEDAELDLFEHVGTPEEGYRIVSQLMVQRPVTVAVAVEPDGVQFATTAYLEREGSVPEVALELFKAGFRALTDLQSRVESEMAPRAVAL